MKTELDPFIVKNILGCPTVSSCPVSSSSGVDPVVVVVFLLDVLVHDEC